MERRAEMKTYQLFSGLILGTIMGLSGCGTDATIDQTAMDAHRSKFLLKSEPEGAISISEAKTSITNRSQVVLVGRINAGDHEPWDTSRSAFVIRDATASLIDGSPEPTSGEHDHHGHDDGHDHDHAGHDHDDDDHAGHDHGDGHDHDHADHDHGGGDDHGHAGHDHSNCKFCQQAQGAAESQAIIQFADDNGEVLHFDPRELLGVSKNQLVVIRGDALVDELGTLVVDANGIYVRN